MFLLAKYGTQTVFRFPMVKRGVADLADTGDWTPATGDTKISKDGGNFANTTNNPSATGGTGSVGWTLTVTATELQCAEANVQIVDSATKAVEDQWITIYTYGNASAKIVSDLGDIATATALATVAGYVDTEVAAILAAVDTEVAAIKAKTDGLTFTTAGIVDANVKRVTNIAITGTGTTVDPWGP